MLETIRKEEKENKQEELGIKKWTEKEKEKEEMGNICDPYNEF